ncbi:MAG TPA: hypothetical protein VLT84_10060 [Acidobacteriota bacterium]|nr:hypothetical protein [Acidobacteriota bacterium]
MRVACSLALLGLLVLAPRSARAQEYDDYSVFIPDSVFEAGPRRPVTYLTSYTRDQARGSWTQALDYSRALGRFSINLSGGSSTSEDLLTEGSNSVSGDLAGRVDWRATTDFFMSVSGNSTMSSISDGARSSSSEQRRNRLGLYGQYRIEPVSGARFTILGSSEFQQNHDLRNTVRPVAGNGGNPDSLFTQRDSSYFSGRQDALRGRLDWKITQGLEFGGTASGSRTRPTTNVRSRESTTPLDGSQGVGSDSSRSSRLPADDSGLEGRLTLTRLRATKLEIASRMRGTDQVYFDLGQLKVEQFSNDTRNHTAFFQTAMLPKTVVSVQASMNRSERSYQARPNLNALVTSREIQSTAGFSTPGTMLFTSFTVNRTRAEQQATGNGIVLSRALTTNLSHRLFGRLYAFGLGSATLYSYRYITAAEDRDIASAFGSAGLRFAVTPKCSTSANFAISRVHNVSIDASQSAGNLSTTVYQLNGALRLPLSRALSIGQDYVLSASYRIFDYDESRNDLSRNWRIDTTVADTLSRHLYLRLDHRYFFFDRGDFSPLETGGPRLYGIQQEQAQQTLEGTVGIRPVPGIVFVVKQSLSDTQNRDILNKTTRGTEQWNLSLGLEVNRTIWGNGGLSGAIRRESRYQNLSTGGPR